VEAVIDQLRRSPKLALYLRDLEEVLRAESPRREQFRNDLDETTKAEFINGEVVVHSPAREAHNAAVGRLFRIISTFAEAKHVGVVRIEKALIGLTRNDYEPDICFWSTKKSSSFTPDLMVYPAPDFIVEVLSPTTAANDRGVKFEDYAAHGIGEYWIVDPTSETIEQYLVRGDQYHLEQKTVDGTIRNHIITGFSLPTRAAFDDAENLAALRRALA
jgi:Uma2 family endonuclease